jgi:hypothetical protein
MSRSSFKFLFWNIWHRSKRLRPEILRILLLFCSSGDWTQGLTHAGHAPGLCLFLWYWGLKSGPTLWATPPALFDDGFFQDRVSRTICPCWLWTMILLISASWVVRITGMSHCAWLVFCFCDRVSLLFPGWPQTHHPPFSASWVAGTACVYHPHLAKN